MNAPDEYEVEMIFGWLVKDGESYYWVKWRNYPMSQATCEPEVHLANAANRVLFFHYCLQILGATHVSYANDGSWMVFILPQNAYITLEFGPDTDSDSDTDYVSDTDDASDTSIEEVDNSNDSDYVPETEDKSDDG